MNYYEEFGKINKKINKLQRCKANCGSGGSVEVIEVTKAQFLALVSANTLAFPAIYKITNIENGLFLETLSANTFSATGTMFALLPNYTPDGNYKGQYHSALGAVANGEIYTWGEFNYLNESGGALTPSLPNPNSFDTLNRFTQLAKSEANYYTNCKLNVVIDSALNITNVEHSLKLNSFDYSLQNVVNANNTRAAFASLNLNNTPDYYGANRGVLVFNCRVENTEDVSFFGIATNSTNGYIATISNSYILGQGGINSNVFFADGTIDNILGNVRVRKNVIGGSGSKITDISTSDGFFIDILHNELHDNNRIINITATGENEMYIWDNHLHENNDVDGWDIDNTFVRFANCHLNNQVSLTNFTFNDGVDKVININFGHNFTIDNLTNLTINSFSAQFPQETFNLYDLAGFTSDIIGESIEAGKGWFSYKRNFATSNLLTTDTILHNIIPIGARITNLVVSGSANGNSIQIGLSGDDESLLILPTSLLNNQLITVSNAATGNRSLLIKALTDPITTGEITVKCEFVI